MVNMFDHEASLRAHNRRNFDLSKIISTKDAKLDNSLKQFLLYRKNKNISIINKQMVSYPDLCKESEIMSSRNLSPRIKSPMKHY